MRGSKKQLAGTTGQCKSLHPAIAEGALLYVAEHDCKWRGLPNLFGNCHTIYTRMNRWSRSGALDKIFEKLQMELIIGPKHCEASYTMRDDKLHAV